VTGVRRGHIVFAAMPARTYYTYVHTVPTYDAAALCPGAQRKRLTAGPTLLRARGKALQLHTSRPSEAPAGAWWWWWWWRWWRWWSSTLQSTPPFGACICTRRLRIYADVCVVATSPSFVPSSSSSSTSQSARPTHGALCMYVSMRARHACMHACVLNENKYRCPDRDMGHGEGGGGNAQLPPPLSLSLSLSKRGHSVLRTGKKRKEKEKKKKKKGKEKTKNRSKKQRKWGIFSPWLRSGSAAHVCKYLSM